MLYALVRGPAAARISTLFLALALVPYLPINWILAPRYVYLASVPFSILSAFVLADIARIAWPIPRALPVALAAFALAGIGLSAWQSWEQNQVIAQDAGRWRAFVEGLQQRYPDLPEGSRIYVRGGPLADPLWQQQVMPAIGLVLWRDVELYNAPTKGRHLCASPEGPTYVVNFSGESFRPLLEGKRASAQLVAVDPIAGGVPPLIVNCDKDAPS
jgi:hypothetical protein